MTLSSVMEKLAQPGEGGGCTPIPFHYISTITYKIVVYTPAERADTLPLFLLYPFVYSVFTPVPKVGTSGLIHVWRIPQAEYQFYRYSDIVIFVLVNVLSHSCRL
jgi:hypothetical protein